MLILRQKLLMEQFWKPMFSLVNLLTAAILQTPFFFFAFPFYFNLHCLVSGIFLKAQYLHSVFFQLLKHLYSLYFFRELKDLCWECKVPGDVSLVFWFVFSFPPSKHWNEHWEHCCSLALRNVNICTVYFISSKHSWGHAWKSFYCFGSS